MFSFFKFFSSVNQLTAEEGYNRLKDNNTIFIDVRNEMEQRQDGYIKGSKLLTLQWFKNEQVEPFKDKNIIIYCRSGNRSEMACRILNTKGIKANNLIGGITNWKNNNYPVQKK